MGHARALRRFLVPAAGTTKIVGTTTYVAADVVDYSAAAQGGSAQAQSVLGTALPGLAIAKGVFDIANGLAFWWDEDVYDTRYKTPNLPGQMPPGRSQPLLDKGDEPDPGKQPSIDRFFYSRNERRIRGLLQTLSGAFLLDGGIEAAKGTDVFHLNNGLGSQSLLWRMAISSYIDFALTFHDFYKQLRGHQFPQNAKKDFISELLIKGLNAAGWTALAIGGPVGLPFGMACLVAATMITVWKHHKEIGPYAAAFFRNIASEIYDKDRGGCLPSLRGPSLSSKKE